LKCFFIWFFISDNMLINNDFDLSIFLFLLPPYVANAIPVFLGGEMPIDDLLKVKFKLFGKNKTILGTLSAFSAGTITGYAISFFSPFPFKESFIIAIISVIGAIFGDLLGSLIKRRLNMEEGSEFWLDSILFIITSMIFVNFYKNIFSPTLFIIILIITFFVHKIANFIAYVLKLKKVPW